MYDLIILLGEYNVWTGAIPQETSFTGDRWKRFPETRKVIDGRIQTPVRRREADDDKHSWYELLETKIADIIVDSGLPFNTILS